MTIAPKNRLVRRACVLAPQVLLLFAIPLAGLAADSDGAEFFEAKIRPLFAEKCYACHSGKVASGGLRLDEASAFQKGGHRGPAVIAGDTSGSLLLKAVAHDDPALKMPPAGKLSNEQIADLAHWVTLGAPYPAVGPSEESSARLRHWSFQPVRPSPPPTVKDAAWPRNWVDRFVLAKLEEKGLRPAAEADKRALIRRVSFDVIGLPPTPEEVEAFIRDESPQAYEKLVERLLASPHYGERWARHWLDLVRYAETDGHEFDREKPNAWRYRDYVIRALNQNLPYDRFVREHIAGDLLETQRMAPDGLHWESPIATGFFGLGEERNAADDLGEVRADKVDNQIDVIGKAFLGLTIACARCHDHKFDPIPTDDYYALAGVLHSKQTLQTQLDARATVRERESLLKQVGQLDDKIGQLLKPAHSDLSEQAVRYIQAAFPLYVAQLPSATPEDIAAAATEKKLDPKRLAAWVAALRAAKDRREDLLHPLALLGNPAPEQAAQAFQDRYNWLRGELRRLAGPAAAADPARNDRVVADFTKGIPADWTIEGPAMKLSQRPEAGQRMDGYHGGTVLNSASHGLNSLTGFLYSPSFVADRAYMHVRMAAGEDPTSRRQPGLLRVSLVGDGRDLPFTARGANVFEWHTSRLGRMGGGVVYVEVTDQSRQGYLAVQQIILSDHKDPPSLSPNVRLIEAMERETPRSTEELLSLYGNLICEVAERGDSASGAILSLAALGSSVEEAVAEARPDLTATYQALTKERRDLIARLPEPAFGLTTRDDWPRDIPLHVRGSHQSLGEKVPRGFLTHIPGPQREAYQSGSGRLALAKAIASPQNPLTARVFVNRIWQHYFGQALVRTPDNFGLTGARPTHPELLDSMAARFMEGGWNVKDLHRTLLLSSTYRMSSSADPQAVAADGDNRLLHHMPVRRLEAETVRDAILAATGTLDRAMFGPSVPPHISAYQDGRGKPQSGPLDGARRRSVYIGVRRNFLPPLLVAFDYPMSVTTIGRRGTSTVPSQALMLMNNEFVLEQARRWSERLLAEYADDRQRIDRMFYEAFGRPAQGREADLAATFLVRQAEKHPQHDAREQSWTDLAHSLLNTKEFLFIR